MLVPVSNLWSIVRGNNLSYERYKNFEKLDSIIGIALLVLGALAASGSLPLGTIPPYVLIGLGSFQLSGFLNTLVSDVIFSLPGRDAPKVSQDSHAEDETCDSDTEITLDQASHHSRSREVFKV